MKNVWFKTKTYGWGWTPASWQGWLTLVMYLVLMGYSVWRFDHVSHSDSDTLVNFVLPTFILTMILLVICWKTGEKPRWRWGKDT